MSELLRPSDFPAFFTALPHNGDHPPYPWQQRLAERLCDADRSDRAAGWPGAIDLPTGSGKTATLEAAVFALAAQAARAVEERVAPRRIIFCVNRRVIVAGANNRARSIAEALAEAEKQAGSSILTRVAAALRSLTGRDPEDAPPLDAIESRGGLFRDDRWVRSATQPTILSCTVDQLGSRLLFRGYGVRPRLQPVHAAMLACDSVVLLDEAHISRPFEQTLRAIQRFAADRTTDPDAPALAASEPIGPRPLVVVPMTATPAADPGPGGLLRLQVDDRSALASKLTAAKPARIDACTPAQLTRRLTEEAVAMLRDGDEPRVVAVIVNRVATAKAVFTALQNASKKADLAPERIELVIGAMRPVDRDEQMNRLEALTGTRRGEAPAVVVATQCIEVGADYDFDALVTQTASLDALRQRFGRLNRGGRPIPAPALILHDSHTGADPIYGDAAAATHAWLEQEADGGVVDFGIDELQNRWSTLGVADRQKLLGPGSRLDAPLLLPSHLDLLAQTSPAGKPTPEVNLFLHGPQRDLATVGVCWRADLDPDLEGDKRASAWSRAVDALPPVSSECMPVPLGRFLAWTRGEKLEKDDSGDAAAATAAADPRGRSAAYRSWCVHRGRNDGGGVNARPRPGDTIVLPIRSAKGDGGIPGLDLGHLPGASTRQAIELDVAERATLQAQDRAVLRLHPLLDALGDRGRLRALEVEPDPHAHLAAEEESGVSRDERLRSALAAAVSADRQAKPPAAIVHAIAAQTPRVTRVPGGETLLVRLPRRLGLVNAAPGGVTADASSRESERQSLDAHTADVSAALQRSLERLPLGKHARALRLTARHHDEGKRDPRFQAFLLGRSPEEARLWLAQGVVFAKSDAGWLSPAEVGRDRRRAGLPAGFRHEMLSVQLAERNPRLLDELADAPAELSLVLHLTGSHHGSGRPFAPVPEAADGSFGDPDPPAVRGSDAEGRSVEFIPAERRASEVHRLGSGVADRYASLTRRFGWWGLAYLESVLRLADQEASANPQTRDAEASGSPRLLLLRQAAAVEPRASPSITLPGLQAAGPLGFLAALGLLRSLTLENPEVEPRLGWARHGPGFVAEVEAGLESDALLDRLTKLLNAAPEAHPASDWALVRDAEKEPGPFRELLQALSGTPNAAWATAWGVEPLPDGLTEGGKLYSQLQVSRRDYHVKAVDNLLGNVTRDQLARTLFAPWDYADPLEGVSLHLDPTEDRRHAYQWNRPAGDPDRKSRGNMIGANRLAIEAYPLFPCVHLGEASQTLGFTGTRVSNQRWTWPVWSRPLTLAEVSLTLGLAELQEKEPDPGVLRARGLIAAFRSRRILVGKTPNLTPAESLLA